MKTSRTRGATKVPNVKLRPAEASSSRLTKRQANLSRTRSRDDDVAECELDLTAGNRPFKGIVLCATGNLDKRTLFAHAQELGAIRSNDFTDTVTHLVADIPGSAKYRCAMERGLPILKESWVEETYQRWLDGEVVDLDQTMNDHRLPIFSGVRLCLAEIDGPKSQGEIHNLLAKERGVLVHYPDKLTTHIVSCASGESPQLEWVYDYNKTQLPSHRIHVLWEEWFWDSLTCGGRCDERDYEFTKPRPARKIPPRLSSDGLNKNTLPNTTLHQRTPLPSSIPVSSLLGDDPPEYGSVNAVPQARQLFYNTIFQQRERHLQRACDMDVVTKPPPEHKPSDCKNKDTNEVFCTSSSHPDLNSDSVLTRLASHRVTSFGPASQTQRRQPFMRIASSTDTRDLQESSDRKFASDITSHLFDGYTFRAFGEANGANLRDALKAHGGRWLTEDDDDPADFLIVRLVSGAMYWQDEGDDVERAKYRTECWLESCIFEERICAPQEHVVFTPLKVETPVPGSEKLRLSLSGLDSAEVCWVKRLIRSLGGNFLPTFSRNSTHLICPSMCGAKFEKAKEWGVNVVGTEWLIKIATTGKIPHATRSITLSLESPIKVTYDMKKAVDTAGDRNEDEKIVDITNGFSSKSGLSKQSCTSFGPPSPKPKRQALATSDVPQMTPFTSATDQAKSVYQKPSPDSDLIFGKPNRLLSGGCFASPSKMLVSESPASPLSMIPRPPSSPPPSVSQKRADRISSHATATEIERDKGKALIPSSHSPSPLKILSKPSPTSSPPISEVGGLRTAITALLGKRSTEERDKTDGQSMKPQRRSKRPRPSSRAIVDLEPRRDRSPAVSFLSTSPPLSRLPYSEDVDEVPEEGHATLRVVYDDPGQRAEKRRLIALFEGFTAPEVSVESKCPSDDRICKHDASTGVVNDAKSAQNRRNGRKNTRTADN